MPELLKIVKIGGSFKVTLPKQLFDMLGWDAKDKVKVRVADDKNLLVINVDLEKRGKGNEEKKDFFQG